MNDNTFIKLNRKILEWGWYKDVNTFKLFVHLLLKANIKQSEFCGQKIERGQIVTSRANLSLETGLTEQQIKTAIKHLISTNEITKRSTRKFTIITINNYEKYQRVTKKPTNKQPTANQQPTNKQPTANQQPTNKQPQYKNIYNNKLLYIKNGRSEESTPTLSQIQNFVAENSLNVDAEKFFEYYSKRDWKTSEGKPIDNVGQLLFAWHKKEKNAYVSGYGKFRNEFTREDYIAMMKEQQEEQDNAE